MFGRRQSCDLLDVLWRAREADVRVVRDLPREWIARGPIYDRALRNTTRTSFIISSEPHREVTEIQKDPFVLDSELRYVSSARFGRSVGVQRLARCVWLSKTLLTVQSQTPVALQNPTRLLWRCARPCARRRLGPRYRFAMLLTRISAVSGPILGRFQSDFDF